MRQMLLQNAAAILLQNASGSLLQIILRQFYYKMRQYNRLCNKIASHSID